MAESASEFAPNDYRKRVLAAVEARGGPEASDPFELYDVPLDADWPDAAVAERVAAVWGFWQRQRDHPKYRVIVAQLVEEHEHRSAELLDSGRRRTAAIRVRAQREQRDAQRYVLLDAAIARLVDRHGGVPRDKVEGLHEVGVLAGLDRAEVEARLRRHRSVDAGLPPERRQQVAALLAELGRLTGDDAPPTLLALLELDPAATPPQVRARAAALRSRARELPAARLRAVLDELLVHVAELLESGSIAVYLDAVALDVADHLRPQVRAAVLVEDRLVADDHAHLIDEAVARGLDRGRAVTVLAGLAAELGVPVEVPATAGSGRPAEGRAAHGRGTRDSGTRDSGTRDSGTRDSGTRDSGTPDRASADPRDRSWEEPLRRARAALRAGRPLEARASADEARRSAGGSGATQVRAVTDEIADVLAAAARRWRAAAAAVAARRFVEAATVLDELQRTAADVPGPDGAPAAAVATTVAAELERADRAVAAAATGPEAGRVAALRAVLTLCADHPGALAALAAVPVAAPTGVRAARGARGDVVVRWVPSTTPDVVYKITRLGPGGRRSVVGRVTGTTVEDGGAPAGGGLPVYAVAAVQDGRSSAEARSDDPPQAPDGTGGTGGPGSPAVPVRSAASNGSAPPAGSTEGAGAGPAAALPDPPVEVRAERQPDGSVTVRWSGGPPGAEYRVRCLDASGRARVVGRTRGTAMEDGGAPPGPLCAYAVSAAVGGARSAERRTD